MLIHWTLVNRGVFEEKKNSERSRAGNFPVEMSYKRIFFSLKEKKIREIGWATSAVLIDWTLVKRGVFEKKTVKGIESESYF